MYNFTTLVSNDTVYTSYVLIKNDTDDMMFAITISLSSGTSWRSSRTFALVVLSRDEFRRASSEQFWVTRATAMELATSCDIFSTYPLLQGYGELSIYASSLWLDWLSLPADQSDQITRRWFTENISSWQQPRVWLHANRIQWSEY